MESHGSVRVRQDVHVAVAAEELMSISLSDLCIVVVLCGHTHCTPLAQGAHAQIEKCIQVMVKSLGKRIARKTPARSSVALAPVVGYISPAPVGYAAPALLWSTLRLRLQCTLHLHLPMGTIPLLLLCQMWRVSRQQCPALLLHNISVSLASVFRCTHLDLQGHQESESATRAVSSGMRHRPSVAGKCDTRAARAVAARLGYMWRKSKQVERAACDRLLADMGTVLQYGDELAEIGPVLTKLASSGDGVVMPSVQHFALQQLASPAATVADHKTANLELERQVAVAETLEKRARDVETFVAVVDKLETRVEEMERSVRDVEKLSDLAEVRQVVVAAEEGEGRGDYRGFARGRHDEHLREVPAVGKAGRARACGAFCAAGGVVQA